MKAKKILQQAATNYRRKYPYQYAAYCGLIKEMARYIKEKGTTEVTAVQSYRRGKVEIYANSQY